LEQYRVVADYVIRAFTPITLEVANQQKEADALRALKPLNRQLKALAAVSDTLREIYGVVYRKTATMDAFARYDRLHRPIFEAVSALAVAMKFADGFIDVVSYTHDTADSAAIDTYAADMLDSMPELLVGVIERADLFKQANVWPLVTAMLREL
jgi:hypothetical protein